MIEVTLQEVMQINTNIRLLLRGNAQDVSSHEQVACSGCQHALKGRTGETMCGLVLGTSWSFSMLQ